MIRDHSRIILVPNSGHLPIYTCRDRAPGLLALPGAFAPGPKLPALSCQVATHVMGTSELCYQFTTIH